MRECVLLTMVQIICWIIIPKFIGISMMSLEDDDYNELFITQTPSSDDTEQKSPILGDRFDFGVPLVSLVSKSQNTYQEQHYSDISDDEDFQVPSSQMASQVDK